MHHGLWNLELFGHIYNAASTRWSWSTHDLNCFVEQYVEWCRFRWGLEGIQTISECVVDLCPTEPTILNRRFSFLIAIPSPSDLALQTCWSLPVVPVDTQVNAAWGRLRCFPKRRNTVLNYYNAVLRGGAKGPPNPLWELDFRAFRRVGIPLWDRWRLYQMRLMKISRSVLSPEGNLVGGEADCIEWSRWGVIYTWCSLAEDDDVLLEFRK